MSNYNKKYNKDDFVTHKATIDLSHNGGAWDYKSNSKAVFYDHTSKKQFQATEFANWLNSPHIKDMINRGANLKIATQDFEDEQAKYGDGLKRKVIFYFSALKNPPAKPVDGFKPIGQAMPRYTQQPMTQAQPSAPDHAVPVQNMNDMDDEIPF